MSKIKDTLLDERNFRTEDNWIEHELHDEYDVHCSLCYSELVRTGCRNMRCLMNAYKEEATTACIACQSKAEETDIGI